MTTKYSVPDFVFNSGGRTWYYNFIFTLEQFISGKKHKQQQQKDDDDDDINNSNNNKTKKNRFLKNGIN